MNIEYFRQYKEEFPSESFQLALLVSASCHEGQYYFDNHPYFLHPLRVSQAQGIKNYLPLEIMALLHDTVEDTDLSLENIEELFGSIIATGVDRLTRKDGQDYFEYIRQVGHFQLASEVKKADLRDNIAHLKVHDKENLLLRYVKALAILEEVKLVEELFEEYDDLWKALAKL